MTKSIFSKFVALKKETTTYDPKFSKLIYLKRQKDVHFSPRCLFLLLQPSKCPALTGIISLCLAKQKLIQFRSRQKLHHIVNFARWQTKQTHILERAEIGEDIFLFFIFISLYYQRRIICQLLQLLR